MSPKLIQIKPGEQIDTLIKYLRNSPETEIIFVDEDNRLLLREDNLHLLSYFLDEEKKKAIVISESPEVRILCRRYNIPAYEKLTSVEKEEILPPVAAVKDTEYARRPKTALPNARLWFWAALLLIIFLVLLFSLSILTPHVTIVVMPQVKPILNDFTVTATVGNETGKKETLNARLLPKEVEIKMTYPTSGHKNIGIKESEGVALFINSGAKPIVIPKGTVVSTSNGIKFTTQKEAIVPKLTAEKFFDITTGLNAGRTEVNIKALEKGTIGNIKEGRIIKIEGKYSEYLRVVNPEPTRYGQDKLIRIVDPEDIKEAKTLVAKELADKAEEELAALVTPEYLFLKELIRIEGENYTYSPQIGEESEQVEMTVKFHASVLVVSRAELSKYLSPKIIKKVPPEYNVLDGTIMILEPVMVNQSAVKGRAELLVKTQADIIGDIDVETLKKELAGQSLVEARNILAGMPEIGGFEIHPGGKMKELPRFPILIKIVVQRPTKK